MKREFPDHPLVGVGGVAIHRNRVLLIRRGAEPLKGEWSIPGGLVELGEELREGARRELREETGLDVEPLEVIAIFDRIIRGTSRSSLEAVKRSADTAPPLASGSKGNRARRRGRVRYHYVIIDYACRLQGGRLTPGSDVVDARWVRREDLPEYHLTAMAKEVISRAFELLNPKPARSRASPPIRRKLEAR